MTRRVSRVLLALMLALALTACSTGGQSTADTSGSSGGSSDSGTDSGPAAISADTINELLEGELASEPWASSVTEVQEATYLRRPVVSIGFADEAARNEAQTVIQDAFLEREEWGVLEIYSPVLSGFQTIGNSSSFPVIELPATPASAPEFAGWLDAAFGSGSPEPEAWVEHVQSSEYAASLPTGNYEVLIVRTDLPFDQTGQRTAQLIIQAIYTAEPTFAKQFAVYYADGSNMTAGDIVPGLAAFGY